MPLYTDMIMDNFEDYANHHEDDGVIKLQNMPEDASMEQWGAKLQEIADEFICAPRYFLMCWLASYCQDKDLLDDETYTREFPAFTYQREGGRKKFEFQSVSKEHAQNLEEDERDQYIDNYIETLENLGKEDIHLVCYNFMPVFDWTRTELARMRPDGSTVLAYTQEAVDALDPEKMFDSIAGDMNGTVMPGWEPERMEHVKELFEMYKEIDDEKLFENLKYFLERIMPVCDKYDINMAIHPDDPAWSVFGLPRIIINKKNILRMMEMVDNPHNGVTFCSGSYGTNLENDLPDMIRSLKGRIHFAHVRNLKFNSPTDFEEAAHLSSDGTFDMYEIMKALYDIGFDGPIRPDHGRMIWGEVAMPGYGLYDRALGATYLNGLWEAIEKGETRHAVK